MKMFLENVAMLASDTARTRAYLQLMGKKSIFPGICIVYTDDLHKLTCDEAAYIEDNSVCDYFEKNEPILYTIKKYNIPYQIVEEKDINSKLLCDVITQCSAKYMIYSGYGGYILKQHLFQMGKRYIHVHAGILPQYRGSTTAYYSILQEKMLGASAIFLTPGLDEGNIIYSQKFSLPSDSIDVDYIYEPYIRAVVLLKALQKRFIDRDESVMTQTGSGAETYFIIHPVLKHLALLHLENKGRSMQ